MAISSYGVFLMMAKNATPAKFDKLVDIKDFPDIGAAPDNLDTTTLSNKGRTYIPGIEDNGNKEFKCNYTKEDYAALKALKGQKNKYGIWMGGSESAGVVTPTGEYGKWDFDGYLDVYVNGAGVNEVVEMTVVIAPASDVNDHQNEG